MACWLAQKMTVCVMALMEIQYFVVETDLRGLIFLHII